MVLARACKFSHDEDGVAFWISFSKDNIICVFSWILSIINVLEEVSKEDCMLFVITTSEVQELLARRKNIRHVFEHCQVINKGNHRDKSGSFLDSEVVFHASFEVHNFQRRLDRSQESAQQDTFTVDVFTENSELAVLEKFAIGNEPITTFL